MQEQEMDLSPFLSSIEKIRQQETVVKMMKQELERTTEKANSRFRSVLKALAKLLWNYAKSMEGLEGNLKEVKCEVTEEGVIDHLVTYEEYTCSKLPDAQGEDAGKEFIEDVERKFRIPRRYLNVNFSCVKIPK